MNQLLPAKKGVAFLGPSGTFSHGAVLKVFGMGAKLVGCSTIDDVFLAVEDAQASFGVVPVENSTEGAVNNTLDCLLETRVRIVGEVVVPIEHHLLARPGTKQGQLSAVVSHKQSLAQCRKWLARECPKLAQQEATSNAAAASLAAETPGLAAIAGSMAAEAYGLEILAPGIQDLSDNSTRFLVIGDETKPATGCDKTSLLIHTENKPGALFRVLEPFERNGVSLTRIETRPSRKGVWDYVFFIDFEGHVDDAPVAQVLEKLTHCTAEVRLLGSYPRAESNS